MACVGLRSPAQPMAVNKARLPKFNHPKRVSINPHTKDRKHKISIAQLYPETNLIASEEEREVHDGEKIKKSVT